jgi:hypothetical protein
MRNYSDDRLMSGSQKGRKPLSVSARTMPAPKVGLGVRRDKAVFSSGCTQRRRRKGRYAPYSLRSRRRPGRPLRRHTGHKASCNAGKSQTKSSALKLTAWQQSWGRPSSRSYRHRYLVEDKKWLSVQP